MASSSQKKAAQAHRGRSASRGLVRIEVQAQRSDAGLIRAFAESLRGDPDVAGKVRASMAKVLAPPQGRTALDVFGSDLPDDAFEGIFDHPRTREWRDVEL